MGFAGDLVHGGAIVVANGAITLRNGLTALTIIACLGYVAPFMSAKLAYAAQLGSALTQRKRVNHLCMVPYDPHFQGAHYGHRFDVLDQLPLADSAATTPSATPCSDND